MLNNKTILITGGTGSFGKKCTEIILKRYKPEKLIIFSRDELKQLEMSQILSEKEYPSIRYFLGDVRDDDLPLLYNCADLFVYPSLCEGFGLPPLEAMACGVPIITSNTSSLPEVVGSAGIMVDPCDINSLSEAMNNVLEDKELKHRMSRDGLKRSKMFTWEKTVSEVLEIYKEVLS